MDNYFKLYNGDCLELMNNIPDKSIDMILCDLPYGVTRCKWDAIIPFEPLWEQYNRIIKDNGAIVLFATQPFSSLLVVSNIKNFKHEWIWQKEKGIGFQIAKYRPMQEHEHILVFTNKKQRVNYYPLMEERDAIYTRKGCVGDLNRSKNQVCCLSNATIKDRTYTHKYPTSIKKFKRDIGLHPTQKPVALLEYLIKTYTNEGETVLDNCMGSGSTGVACLNTNRKFIGIELDDDYFNIAKNRIMNN